MQDCNAMQHNVIKEWYFQESDEFHTPDPVEGVSYRSCYDAGEEDRLS